MNGRILVEPHAHTSEVSPCGWLSARELVEALKENGYGAVVITDHFKDGIGANRLLRDGFLKGYRAAKEAGEALGVTVLPGMEICFKERPEDFLVYGMEEEDILDLPDDVCEKGLSEFHVLAKQHGWCVYQAHPFRPKLFPAHTAFIDGMEIFNGNPRHNSQNRMAAKFATLHSLHTIAGSDVHRPGDAGIAGLYVPQEALTPKGFAGWLGATPHPRIHYQDAPIDGIRYVVGAIPGMGMLEALYADAGWTSYTGTMKESYAGICNSSRIITAWDDTTLVGMARAITDGHTVAYVQDILVLATQKRKGIGRELLRRLLLPYRDVRQIVLITDDTPETRGFYRACGFENLSTYNCAGFVRLR